VSYILHLMLTFFKGRFGGKAIVALARYIATTSQLRSYCEKETTCKEVETKMDENILFWFFCLVFPSFVDCFSLC
jgi:hypothetical protein